MIKSGAFFLIAALAIPLVTAHLALAQEGAGPDVSRQEKQGQENQGRGHETGERGEEPAVGLTDPGAAALEESLGIRALFGVLAREGQAYGDSLDRDMLGGRGGMRWQAAVARIYDPNLLEARFSHAFAEALQGAQAAQPGLIATAHDFFSSPLGQKIVGLERDAREALLDPDAKEAAEVAAERLREARSPRLRQFRSLIEAGDLVEGNVASGLTGAAAFSEALVAGLPEAQRLPEAERMAQVWRQEADIRATSAAWLVTFMTLAYAPLSDEEVQAWVDFSASDSGRALNRALFAAYSETFREVMAGLGDQAGQVLRGSRI